MRSQAIGNGCVEVNRRGSVSRERKWVCGHPYRWVSVEVQGEEDEC